MPGKNRGLGFLTFYARMEMYIDRATYQALRIAPVLGYLYNRESLKAAILEKLVDNLSEVNTSKEVEYLLFVYEQVKQVIIGAYRDSRLLDSAIETNQSENAVQAMTECHARISSDENEPRTADEWIAFHESVSCLEPEERRVIQLTYYGGLSRTEVSQLLAVSPNTILEIQKQSHSKLLHRHLIKRFDLSQPDEVAPKIRIEVNITLTPRSKDRPECM